MRRKKDSGLRGTCWTLRLNVLLDTLPLLIFFSETTEIYYLTAVEPRSLRSRCYSLSEGSRGDPSLLLASFWCLLAILRFPLPVGASPQSLPLSSPDLLPYLSVCLYLFCFLRGTPFWTQGPLYPHSHPMKVGTILASFYRGDAETEGSFQSWAFFLKTLFKITEFKNDKAGT